MRFLIVALLILVPLAGLADINVPDDSRYPITNALPWNPGVQGGIPAFSNAVNVMNYGAHADGATSDSTAFANALAACSAGGMVFVPAGTYYLGTTVNIPSNKGIRGAGPNVTIIKGPGPSFTISGGGSSLYTMTADAARGATNVVVSSASGLHAGDYILIQQHNDTSLIPTGDGNPCTDAQCQWERVYSVSGTTVNFTRPLYWPYTTGNGAYVRQKPNIVTNAGIESLQIQLTSGENMIKMLVAGNCWVTNVWTTNTTTVDVQHEDMSLQVVGWVTVNHCWLMRASGLSSQYGIQVAGDTSGAGGSGECLVYDNIVDLHTGPIIFQNGTAGSVAAYNYIPRGRTSMNYGLISHGGLANFNLWEGNIGSWVAADSYWGPNHRTTFLRNWGWGKTYHEDGTVSTGHAINVNANNWWMNVIGNIAGRPEKPEDIDFVLTENDDHNGYYDNGASLTNIFLHWNFGYIAGLQTSNSYTTNIVASLYLPSKPDWFGSLVWPPLGPDVNTGSTITNTPLIPAQWLYTYGTNIPPASTVPTISSQPQNQTTLLGNTATFTVSANGSSPLSYQWYNPTFSPISGATNRSYVTPATVSTDNGSQYFCVITNSLGSVTSSIATLTITLIAAQPTNQTVVSGSSATFTVGVSTAGTYAYQWVRNGSSIFGATSGSYTLPSCSLSDSGSQFYCLVSIGGINEQSSTATLTVNSSSVRTANVKKLNAKDNHSAAAPSQ